MQRTLDIAIEQFPLAEPFVIARGAKTAADAVRVTLYSNGCAGHGECIPYPRYGETPQSVCAVIEEARNAIEAGCQRLDLLNIMPAGAARNAVDCALWDLDAKQLGIRAAQLAGLHRLPAAVTAYTISAGTPQAMAASAKAHADKPVLKIKLAGDGDEERIAAVCQAAPLSQLIVDANEALREDTVEAMLAACAAAGVTLIEQPMPAGKDQCLADIHHAVAICADESVHGIDDLAALRKRYDAVNIKLDKTGGLTAALAMTARASELGFSIMIGSMVGTSLSMAPAMLLTPFAQWVDLDGPLLLAKDRNPGLRYDGCIIQPPAAELWG
ncbi:MAG: dipeptide epimerase [Beijerinckiaceae bacterium]|jgi:L-Ala-D/L-Glu epimerase|nr:dipeptide epimerase [Beijerinckiaceae bacterium]